VFVGVNSTVLGPIRIGDRVRIGANTSVTTNVPSDSIVIGSRRRSSGGLTPFAASSGSPPGARPASARAGLSQVDHSVYGLFARNLRSGPRRSR
jgi:serine O-acetyltransferase